MEEATQTTTVRHPINAEIVADVAEEYDVDADVIDTVLTAAQDDLAEFVDDMRDDASQNVAEDESTLVLLDGGHLWTDVANAIGADLDAPEHVRENASMILGAAHDRQFKSFEGRALTGFDEQRAVNALSAADAVFINKPEAEDSYGDVDVEWRIRHDVGYEQPFHYVAEATATVTGELGTLEITRTYRALPDDTSGEDHDAIHVDSEARHVDSDTLVNEYTETWSIDKQLSGTRNRDAFDSDLRAWVYANHTTDFEVEYEAIKETVPLCDNCNAFPAHDSGVYVSQRPTKQFNPGRKDTLCNLCRATFVAEHTMLSRQEAEVYALKESGLSHRETGEALAISKSQVGTIVGRINDKRKRAEQTVNYVPELF